MAGRGGLKGFYILVGLVIVGGIVALVYRSRAASSGASPMPVPIAVADSVPPAAYIVGSDSAPVVVDDYSDFECPFCAQLAILTFPDIRTRLINTGKVRWRFHDRPLNIHPNTMVAHMAAGCAAEQNRFYEMHDQIYFHQGDWAESGNPANYMRQYAKQIGLDMDAYDRCMKTEAPLPRLEADTARENRLGINSTPTLFINGQRYEGQSLGFDDLRKVIDSAAAAARAQSAK